MSSLAPPFGGSDGKQFPWALPLSLEHVFILPMPVTLCWVKRQEKRAAQSRWEDTNSYLWPSAKPLLIGLRGTRTLTLGCASYLERLQHSQALAPIKLSWQCLLSCPLWLCGQTGTWLLGSQEQRTSVGLPWPKWCLCGCKLQWDSQLHPREIWRVGCGCRELGMLGRSLFDSDAMAPSATQIYHEGQGL